MPINQKPSWFGFLKIESNLEITFIDVARSRLTPEGSSRSLENARKAQSQIQWCLMKPTYYGLSEDEISFLEKRSIEIESALRAFVPGKQRLGDNASGH